MNGLIGLGRRRLVAALAGMLIAFGVAVAVGAPAQAQPPGCTLGSGHYEAAGGFITGYRYWFCENGEDIPLNVSVQKYLSPGVWQTVASGTGEATYYCGGYAYNVYKTTGTSQFPILCT